MFWDSYCKGPSSQSPSSESYGFSGFMDGCESWTIKKGKHRWNNAFELWCWRRLLRVPWTARRSNQSILKEISPEYSLQGLMLKLKVQCFGHLMRSWLTGKDPDAGKDWRQEEKGMTEDEMVGWHHRFYGHEFEQAPGVGDGQGSLACCSPWGHKKLDMTERLNCIELNWMPVMCPKKSVISIIGKVTRSVNTSVVCWLCW